MDIKLIETLIDSSESCKKLNTCEICKYEKCCYDDFNKHDLIKVIKELYSKVKVNPDWGI